jgi:arginine deiminase
MVGMGERTTPQGVEFLSRQYFAHGSVTKVIAVELPKARAFMHLDTAMTMIDRDAFSVYPYLPNTLRSFTLTPVGTGGGSGCACDTGNAGGRSGTRPWTPPRRWSPSTGWRR